MALNTNLHRNQSHLWTIAMESSVSQQEKPKYFSHKIKFQDVQDRNRYALLIARVARHSFGTTENCLENNLYKVCKCCKLERWEGARPWGPRASPSALPRPCALHGSLRAPLSRRHSWPRGGTSQASALVSCQHVPPSGPHHEPWELI